jgi:hypothetical protein
MSQTARVLLQLTVLSLVASALGLFAYFGVFKKDQSEAAESERREKLVVRPATDLQGDGGFTKADFSRVTVTFQGEVTVLERQKGSAEWRITAPFEAKVDKLVVDALLSQLQTAKLTVIEATPDDAALKKFGLDTPSFMVEAQLEAGVAPESSVRIAFGLENTYDGSIYVRRGDEKPVYSAQGGVRYAMAKTTFDLRDKQVLAFEEKSLTRIEVKTKANAWTIGRDEHGGWNFEKPFVDQVDGAQLGAMLGAMAGERARSFLIDGAGTRSALGLSHPILEARLVAKDGTTSLLKVGRPPGDAGVGVYVLREEASLQAIAEVAASGALQLDRNPNDFKDKTLLRLKKELVTGLAFHGGDGSEVRLSKDSLDASAEAWRVKAPRAGAAKIFKVTSALWTLTTLKASSFAEKVPKDWTKFGIDDTSRWVALLGADGQELGRLTIGRAVPGKTNVLYARGSRDALAEVDGARLDELPWTLTDVLDVPAGDAGGAAAPQPSH